MPSFPLPSTITSITIIGATGDALLIELGKTLNTATPALHTHLLRPARPGTIPANLFTEVSATPAPQIIPSDIRNAPPTDAIILAIGHVGNPSYNTLLHAIFQQTDSAWVCTPNGLQPVTPLETSDYWPRHMPDPEPRPPSPNKKGTLFFRPFDQYVRLLADQLTQHNNPVFIADTIQAFAEYLTQVDTVFFNFCLTDPCSLAQCFAMARQQNKFIEAFVAMDLADLAETTTMKQQITQLNQLLLPRIDQVHLLQTRPHIAERYAVAQHAIKLIPNVIKDKRWQCSHRPRPPAPGKPIQFVYHGFMYHWHELAEFLPVLNAVNQQHPATLTVFGRSHGDCLCGNAPLLPAKAARGVELTNTLQSLPNVNLKGFVPSLQDVIQTVARSDYYVGITAGNDLMAQTEMRTGVVEAMATGVRVLHKATQAAQISGWQPDIDYLSIDTRNPEQAAATILADYTQPPKPTTSVA